ncbi:MAG: hypothetical protein HY902_05900 [Deltaproteobacteria bacterium]|nr:hypothetical protein [Deltaproteobacteria bacterium]
MATKELALRWLVLGALLMALLAQPAQAAKRRPKKPAKKPAAAALQPGKVRLADVEAWLRAHYPGRTWELGPDPLVSAELAATYPNRQFWVVHSSPPRPSGATPAPAEPAATGPGPTKPPLSALIEVDVTGRISAGHPEMGRLLATTKAEAARVGAAVLSLTMGKWAPPGVISAAAVQVERVPGYWQLTARGPGWLAQARVSESGQLAMATRTYAGPQPP